MANIGIITGRAIGLNRDGDKPRVLLQVELELDDVRTIELIPKSGVDENPGNGCRVVVVDVDGDDNYSVGIAVTDDLTPSVLPGEKEIYSTNSPVTTKLARIKFDTLGNVVNNQGAKSAVTHAELNTALQTMINLIMAHVHTSAVVGNPSSVPTAPITVDISAAESATVKLP